VVVSSFEFEVVTSATDPVVTNDGTIFTAANNSQQWTISDVVVECDTITLDSALQNSYIQHVMSNHALEIKLWNLYQYDLPDWYQVRNILVNIASNTGLNEVYCNILRSVQYC
jgi:hypothetical protein